MIRPLVALGCLLVPSVFLSSANAQIVRVGPWGGVRVRVPLVGVGVDVSPWGDTRVRAPFTRVEAAGDYYYPHHYDRYGHYGEYDRGYRGYYHPHVFSPDYGLPPARGFYGGSQYAPPADAPYHPSGGPVAVSPSEARADSASRRSSAGVAESLRSAAQRLQASLARRGEQGEIWLDYLQPDRIVAAIDGGESPESLEPLVANYEGVTNSQMGWVTQLDGFRQTHRWLAEFVAAGPQAPPRAQDDDARRRGGVETLELPPPAPEPPPRPRPEGAPAEESDPDNDPQSASADSAERFSL